VRLCVYTFRSKVNGYGEGQLMAFCANCGSQVEGRFCAKCGASVGAEAPSGVPSGPGGAFAAPPPAQVQAAGMSENVAGALCYLLTWLTGILFLVLPPYNTNKTIRFHAFQAIFFGVGWTVLWIAISVFTAALSLLGLFFVSILHLFLLLGFFVIWGMLMYK